MISLNDARRIRGRIIRIAAGANFVAAALLFCLLNFLFPGTDQELRTSFISFVVSTAITFPAAMVGGLWLFRPVERWISAGRAPTAAEERYVVLGPGRITTITFLFWVVTAVLIGAIEALDGGPAMEAFRDGVALFAAGLTSAAIVYLLVEREARPLVAAALGGRPPARTATIGLRPRLLLSWALGSGVPLVVLIAGEWSIGPDDPRLSGTAAVVLALIGLVVGALMSTITARSVAEPIGAVREALATVQGGELSVVLAVDDGGEIGQLQAGVNDMVAGLRDRERLADLFGRHVGTQVARRAVSEGIALGGERRNASALFVDLRDSTALAAGSPPEEVVALLNRFFGEVVRTVTSEGGWVNKFEGDGAMCIFGAPASQPDHASCALRAARLLSLRLADAGLRAAIGVSSGDVVAGNVGAEERYEYTVIGDPVNEAARLTQATKDTGHDVLASHASIEPSGEEAANWEPVAEIDLRGRTAPTRAYAPRSIRARA